ncbi:MAG: hypothetical protein JW891_03185 [Candidatus Lokiarchaeota archaeon]|nr:hypothetical protein [Candidatus Lokiarchaeota archaeon]
MWLSPIIIILCFVSVIVLIVSQKVNRAIAALACAMITYFVLIFLEGLDYSVLISLLFGTLEDGFVNLHSLLLIISMMLIIAISNDAGIFQFLAIKLIVFSKGKPMRLTIILCSLCVFIASILNNILAIIILIPLTITISRILAIDPSPFILMEAVIVNIGGSILVISSIPNILISAYAQITFIDFFVNLGIISIVLFFFTIVLFILLYKNEIKIPKEGISILKEFNAWNLVQDNKVFYRCLFGLVILMLLFIFVPPSVISSDIIALSIAIILALISKMNVRDVISKVDLELIFYLCGIFIIAGALEILGILEAIGEGLKNIGAIFLLK